MPPAFVASLAIRGSAPSRLPSRGPVPPRRRHAAARGGAPRARLGALIFDCDGVLADTERDAHRVAFNLAFDEQGLSTEWDAPLYGRLLETGGGKERMTAYWNEVGWPASVPEGARVALVKQLHARKTELFMELVADGGVPLRPGIARLVTEAFAAAVPVAVCSTSNEKAVARIVAMLGANADAISIFAGDVVKKKKPSPDIYNLAAEKLAVDPRNVCVVEDSFIGLEAACEAGMPCVVTKSTYTANEDFTRAMAVLNSLEDPVTSLDSLTALVDARNATPAA